MRSSRYQHIAANIERGGLTTLLLDIFALCLIAVIIWLPRRIHLNRVVTVDESKWFDRSGNFFLALNQGDYAKTYQKEHPGVTVMWIGAAAYEESLQEYLIKNPEYRDRLTLGYFVNGVSQQNPLDILVASRKILALINTIILLLAYWYARRIIGLGAALIGFALIAFDPFHLALTRIMHLDGLLANFYLLSLLAYLSYAQGRKRLDLIVSGVAAGLAWLTKSPGFILIPTLGIVALFQLWQNLRRENRPSTFRMIWREIWPLAVWGLLGVFVFVAAWPAMWVAPLETITKVFGMAGIYASQGHDSDVFFNGHIIAGSDFGLGYFYFYPLTFLWRATPLVIIGLFAFVLGFIKKVKILADPKIRWFSTILLVASLLFTLVMTFGQKKFDRYLIPVYPPMDILAGLGWFVCILWLKDRLPLRFRTIAVVFVSGLVIILQAASSLSLFPDMFAYYNPMLGGGRKAPQVMQIGWGEGLDQAALYLDQKPGANKLVVSSWYGSASFAFFFKGKTINIPSSDLTASELKAINASDYIVIYIHQWQRNLPAELLSELAAKTPEHTIWINNMEYVRIYKQK
jgi:4-amino-4-deoxy-L-arabinose transferase-like glycosyltransferase